jgi:NTE family protein
MTSNGEGHGGVALVLAGAVAKGSFAIGVVSYLAERKEPIRCIAGTSAGALVAAVIGAGVATGQFAYAADCVARLWLERGSFGDIAHLSFDDLLHARGVFDTSKVVALVHEAIRSIVEHGGEAGANVRVTLVTTSLNAQPDPDGPIPTYENPVHFETRDFMDSGRWSAIAEAAAASAAFPVLFAPTVVDGKPCIDGGAVNNTPISYVLDDKSVDTVFVVTTEPAVQPSSGGTQVIGRLAEILVNERMSHDLAVAKKTNARLRRVIEALDETGATKDTRSRVLQALGWRDIQLHLVRPDTPLAGNSFSAFRDRKLREEYMVAGRRAAEKALAGVPKGLGPDPASRLRPPTDA